MRIGNSHRHLMFRRFTHRLLESFTSRVGVDLRKAASARVGYSILDTARVLALDFVLLYYARIMSSPPISPWNGRANSRIGPNFARVLKMSSYQCSHFHCTIKYSSRTSGLNRPQDYSIGSMSQRYEPSPSPQALHTASLASARSPHQRFRLEVQSSPPQRT